MRVGLETDYPPFSFVGPDGLPAGISVDYLRLLEARTGVRFEVTARGDLATLLEKARRGEVDVLTSLMRTPEREAILTFTRPYFSSPAVLVVRRDHRGPERLTDMGDELVAVGRGYAVEEYLRSRHPGLQLVLAPDDAAALRLLLSGGAEGAVVDLASLSWIVNATGMQGLRVLTDVGFTYQLALASRRDLPQVQRLLDEALAGIPPADARRVRDEWIRVDLGSREVDPRIWVWLGPLLVGLALLGMAILGVNWALRREVSRRTAELARSEQRYRLLADHVQDVIWTLDLRSQRFTYVSPSIRSLRGFSPEEAMAEPLGASLTPESLARVRDSMARIGTPDEQDPFTGIVDQPCRDGSVKHVEITTTYVRENGVPVQAVGVSRDATVRVRMERALEERERYLRSVLDTAQDGFLVVDPDGRIVDVNPAVCAMLGYTRDELLGMRIPDIEAAESPEDTARHIATILESGSDRFETRHRRKDGTLLRIATSVTRIEAGGGRMVSFVHDVTERTRSAEVLERTRRTLLMLTRCNEAILRASTEEELFADICRVIVDTGGYRMCWVGVAVNDERRTVRPVAHAGHEDGYLKVIDVVWADVPAGRGPTGTAIREGRVMVGHYIASMDALTPWREEALRRGYASATALPISFEGEMVGALSMYSGDVAPVGEEELRFLRQLADDLAFGVHALRQRTARVRADAGREAALLALSSEQDRFRLLIEGSSDLTLVIDRDGVIRFASPVSQAVLGRAPEELTGALVLDHIHPEDHERARTAMAEVLDSPGASSRVELRVRRADGSHALVESGLRNLLDVQGVAGVVVNNRDITERNRLREQFLQAQKLESVGRLAGGVAHDFNNLLTIILSCGDDMRRDLEGAPAQARENLEDIVAAGRRASDLTRQLLAFARKQVIAPEVVDLNAVLRQSKKLLGRVIGEDVRVVEHYQDDLWPVRCDPGLVGQVVMNLGVNARDAMPRGGTLTLATANLEFRPDDPRPDPEMATGPWVRLSVRDTGVGMSPEVLEHVFEPFFTTKGPGVGTGLGLATVYGIVKQSGAHLAVRSAPGEGTAFDVYFPRAAEDVRKADGPAADPPPGTETVLLVEDDPKVRGVVVRALEGGGYHVLAAEGAEQAYAILRGERAPLHLVVTDVVMPGTGGRDMARRIGELRPGVRVLYVSGYTHDAISQQGVLDEGIEFLPKPFTPAELLARVRAVLDRA